MAFCTKCGAKIPDGAKFCNSCGEKLGNSPTSTEEKIVAFVENFDVKEKISDLKKFSESSKEIAEIKEKISEVKKAAESSKEFAEIKGKISEVKEAVEANEKVAEVRENLQSNEKVAAVLAMMSWKNVAAVIVIIFMLSKFFGGDDSLGITPEEFQKRYNNNLSELVSGRDYENFKILGFDTARSKDGLIHFTFKTSQNYLAIVGFSADEYKPYIHNFQVLSISPNMDDFFKGFIATCTVIAHSVNGKNDLKTGTFKIIEKVSGDAVQSSSGNAKLTDGGFKYTFGCLADNQLRLIFGMSKDK